MITATPLANAYCGFSGLILNDHTAQVNRSIPRGAITFKPIMARFWQSKPMNLPEQKLESGHMTTPSNNTDTEISTHAGNFSIEVSDRHR